MPKHGCAEHWTGGVAGTPSMPGAQAPSSETPPWPGGPGFFFFFLGGKDIHYTKAMKATSRVCDVHHKPKMPKLTTHLEWFRHES